MLRIVENATHNKIIELLLKINLGINSMINDYNNLYTKEELLLFDNIIKMINKVIEKVKNGTFYNKEIYQVLEYEDKLKPYIFKCWYYEVKNGCEYISWWHGNKIGDMPLIVSTTFSSDLKDTFCDYKSGICYEVFIDGFLGACDKDAATLIEDVSRQSLYTIGKTVDGRIVNSYNLATPIITPMQVFDKSNNNYQSKHNEIILDSRYIKPIRIVYTDDQNLEYVNLLSSKYNIPVESRIQKTN